MVSLAMGVVVRLKKEKEMKARILWVEGKRADSPSFVPVLIGKGYNIELVPNGNLALKRITEIKHALETKSSIRPSVNKKSAIDIGKKFSLVVINAASLDTITNGSRICKTLRKNYKKLPVLLITTAEKSIFENGYVNEILTLPFTYRKLVNRLNDLLPDGPSLKTNEKFLLKVGAIQLNFKTNRVRCLNRRSRLTPRLVRILQILMDHAGEVVEREQLFREAWRTEYTGDTRTLDVHISWLRQAIEEDPRHPRYLKTIRRLGYRLDAE